MRVSYSVRVELASPVPNLFMVYVALHVYLVVLDVYTSTHSTRSTDIISTHSGLETLSGIETLPNKLSLSIHRAL